MRKLGGIEAAKQLLAGPEEQSGFTRLWELGHLDWSMEAHVHLDRFVLSLRQRSLQKLRVGYSITTRRFSPITGSARLSSFRRLKDTPVSQLNLLSLSTLIESTGKTP